MFRIGMKATSCVICTNAFNATDRPTVALPCGHNFCITCLICLKDSDSPVCPLCRKSFAEVELPELPRMAQISGPTPSTLAKKPYLTNQKKLAGCEEHKEPFVYWSTTEKQFYCITCILRNNMQTTNLQRIRDAIPLIQEDLENKRQAATEGITCDWQEHTEERKKAIEELEKINNFKKKIEKLEKDYQQFIANVDSHNYKLREQATLVNEIKGKIPEIKSEEDIGVMLSYKKTLEELHKTTIPIRGNRVLAIGYHSGTFQASENNHQVEVMKRPPANLLSDIARVFTEDERQENLFIQKLQQEVQRRNNSLQINYGHHHDFFGFGQF